MSAGDRDLGSGKTANDSAGSGNHPDAPELGCPPIIPDWLCSLKPLLGVLGISALGIKFTDDPIGFVQAVVIEWIVGGTLTAVGMVATMLRDDIWIPLRDSFVAVGRAIGVPLGAGGAALLAAIEAFNAGLVDAAAVAGPAAPLLPALAWGIIAWLVATALARVRGLVSLPGVIPWL